MSIDAASALTDALSALATAEKACCPAQADR